MVWLPLVSVGALPHPAVAANGRTPLAEAIGPAPNAATAVAAATADEIATSPRKSRCLDIRHSFVDARRSQTSAVESIRRLGSTDDIDVDDDVNGVASGGPRAPPAGEHPPPRESFAAPPLIEADERAWRLNHPTESETVTIR